MEFENFNNNPEEEDDEEQEDDKKHKTKKSNLIQNFFSKFKSKDNEEFKLSNLFEIKSPLDKSHESKTVEKEDEAQAEDDTSTSTEITSDDDSSLLIDSESVQLDSLQKSNLAEDDTSTSAEITSGDSDRTLLRPNLGYSLDKSHESKTVEKEDEAQAEDDTSTFTEIISPDEDKIILQSIADIHLSELPHFDRNTKVEYFLTNLSSTGDLHKAYSITSSQFEKGEILNDIELRQPVSRNTIIETSRLNFEYKKPNKKSELPKLVPIVSEKKKSAFEFLNNEIYRIKAVEKPIESSLDLKVGLRSHLERLDNQVEVFKLRIRNEIQGGNIQTIPEQNTLIPQSNNIERNQDKSFENAKQVKLNLSDKEIILISEKIKLENVSLKQIFKNREISLNGMRRVVKEYLATGHFEEILKKELILHQIDFEKDPIYKDVRDEDNMPVQFSSPKSVEELLVEKNLILDNKNNLPIAVKISNNQNIKQDNKLKSNINSQTPKIINPLNIILLSLILILLIVLILVLYFKV